MELAKLGMVAISVDLTSNGGRTNRRSREEATPARLLELLDLYEIPATWAAPEPAASAVVEQIQATQTRHDLAVLGDASWVGETAGRTRFARELARRIQEGRAAGLSLSALLVRGATTPRDHYDLLVKHGVTLVRQPRAAAGRKFAHLQPQSLRHGVWEVPPTVELPRWSSLFGKGAAAARSAVRKAIAGAGLAHVVLNVAALAEEDPRLQVVENVLRCIARRCGRGALSVATLGQLVAQRLRPDSPVPARSILRAA